MSGPRILAIDTTSEFGSIALVDGNFLLEEFALHSPDGFSPVIFGEIRGLLDRHRLSLEDVDGFAAASGPGSFTGVRVGLTVVKGLADALDRKAAAVSNLAALATYGTHPLRAPILDARRGEVYGAVYDSSGAIVQEETVGPLDAWLRSLPIGVQIVTSGFEIPATPVLPKVVSPQIVAPKSIAAAVAGIAVAKWTAGEMQDPSEIAANYVRRSDAELFWRER